MRRINQISVVVILGVFILLLCNYSADTVNDSNNSSSALLLRDTVQSDHSNLDYTKVAKTLEASKLEPVKTKTERLSISLPDIITYFMSSF